MSPVIYEGPVEGARPSFGRYATNFDRPPLMRKRCDKGSEQPLAAEKCNSTSCGCLSQGNSLAAAPLLASKRAAHKPQQSVLGAQMQLYVSLHRDLQLCCPA